MTDRIKRVLDLTLAGPIFLLSLPVQAVAAAAVAVSMGRPVLFRQERPGLHGAPFEMVKFRTMLVPDPEIGLVSDSDRLTRVGSFLRSTSLDELPTLWNVVTGDMGIVGPRPLLMRYLPFMTEDELRRHEVRPGVTGWAQVSGRNNLGWDERLSIDVDYVKHRSLRGDLKCIVRTAAKVLRRSDVNVTPTAHMQDLDVERGARRSHG